MSVTVYVSASSPCILPTTIRSTQCVNYSQSRRGEERRGSTTKGEQQQWSVVSTSIMDLEEKFRWPEGEIRSKSWLRSNSSSIVFRISSLFYLWRMRMFYTLENFWQLRKTGWPILWWIVEGREITWSVNKFERSNISLEELYNTISSDQISTTFILIFLVRTRESG